MSSNAKILCTTLMLLLSVNLMGQSILDGYIKEGLENNQQFIQEALALEISEYDLKQANSLFLPRLSFEANYTRAGGGRLIAFPVGDLLNPVYNNLNQINGNQNFSEIANVNEQFLPDDFHETKVRLIQPLFDSDIYYNQKINERLVSSAAARKDAYKKELIKEIKLGYYQYLQAYQAEKIYQANEKSLIQLVRFNQNRYNEGIVTQDEIFQAEYELEELRAEKAASHADRITAQAYFNFLLSKPHNSPIEADSVSELQSLEEYSINKALQSRDELNQIGQAKTAQNLALKQTNANRYLPKVNLVGDLGYQGFGYTFDSEQDFWLVNLGLSWNIFSGFSNKYKSEQAKVQLNALTSQEEQLKQQITLEIVSARSAFEAAQSRLYSKKKSLNVARKTFKIIEKKYQENEVLLLEYTNAQASYIAAQIDQSIAKYQLLSCQAVLERALDYVTNE